jgi:hypothetical protein
MVDRTGDDAKQLQIRRWRAKAEELRTIADGVKNDHARRGLLNAAANYDRLADDAERETREPTARSTA